MSKPVLAALSTVFVFGAALHLATTVMASVGSVPSPEHPLIAGCSGIPEAVALGDYLTLRGDRLARYTDELSTKRAEIAAAEAMLTERLKQLGEVSARDKVAEVGGAGNVDEDIRRMVAIYDVMKPADAASVLSNLPPDYAVEILMRLGPENSASIVSALDPGAAAILTTHMGARSVRN